MYNWQSLKENPALWAKFLVKQEIIRATRAFFEAKGYNELESPILAPALPSERYLNFLSTDIAGKELYLIPSTERYNKIGLAAGIGNHFVITKVFRGLEQVSPNHRPEFTMLEWYHLDGTYFDLMDDTQALILSMLDRIGNSDYKINYQGIEIDFNGDWHRFSVETLLKTYTGLSLKDISEWEKLKQIVIDFGFLQNKEVKESEMSWQDLFELLFFNKVEIHLDPNKPTFIYDYPKILAPLAAPNSNNPEVSQKVELYIAGKEIANGYTELRDALLLENNLKEEYKARAQMGLPLAKFDDELISAIRSGIPPVAGIGMGLDRLAMILADAQSINEISLLSL